MAYQNDTFSQMSCILLFVSLKSTKFRNILNEYLAFQKILKLRRKQDVTIIAESVRKYCFLSTQITKPIAIAICYSVFQGIRSLLAFWNRLSGAKYVFSLQIIFGKGFWLTGVIKRTCFRSVSNSLKMKAEKSPTRDEMTAF